MNNYMYHFTLTILLFLFYLVLTLTSCLLSINAILTDMSGCSSFLHSPKKGGTGELNKQNWP